ncbi:hypothetical protein I3842_08G172100 [Carya illinoinensis]|uniref:Uncharacterized protein n=1 Tax=Carya illinoinensis TaxID=32201 RepID=A0A922EEL7_CARIL|nr:hypothetical protein I3842_08G172100 [Carya illinoinensis]
MPPPWGPPPGTPGLQGLCGCFDFPLYVLCCCCRRLESCCGPLFGGGPGGPY